MHCAHCGRLLLRDPAATVTTRDGALHWGPKCARMAGILPGRRAMSATKPRTERATDHTWQLDWINEGERS